MKHTFTTEPEARWYIEALGRSRIYRPSLPRCDHPRFLDASERVRAKGRLAPCSCPSRAEPQPGCPWATLRHADVVELDGVYIVEADPREAAVMGEVVDLADGSPPVVLSRVPTKAMTGDDRERARATWPVRETGAEYAERLADRTTERTVRDVRTR